MRLYFRGDVGIEPDRIEIEVLWYTIIHSP